ncbi:Hypothetical predicted protein, partial [Olea europaea subsp. europaea]
IVVSGSSGCVSVGKGNVGGVGEVVGWVLLVCLVVAVVVVFSDEVVVLIFVGI